MSETEEQKKISIIIDFDSVKDSDAVSLINKITEIAKNMGKVVRTRIYFTHEEFSNNKDFIDGILNLGVEPIVVMLARDVKMAIDLLDDSYSDDIDTIIVVYKKEGLIPALIDAKNRKNVILVEFDSIPDSLKNVVDSTIKL